MYIVVRYWDEGCEVKAFKMFEKAYEYMKEEFKSVLMEYGCVLDDKNRVFDNEGNKLERTFIIDDEAQFYGNEERLNWAIRHVAVA